MEDEVSKSIPPWLLPLLYVMGGGSLGAGTTLFSESEHPVCHDLEAEVLVLRAQHDALFDSFQASIALLMECSQ